MYVIMITKKKVATVFWERVGEMKMEKIGWRKERDIQL